MRALVVCAATLLLAGCGGAEPPPATDAPPASAPTDHRLQGTYGMYIDFWKRTENGLPVPQGARNAVYAFRTACAADDVCVATDPVTELRGTHEVVYPDPCPATGAFTLFFQRVDG